MFSELEPEDVQRLEEQRAVARKAAQRVCGVDLRASRADLVALQALVDSGEVAPHQTYDLQCVGVAFGDALAADGLFRWVILTDEYGRDPTLRWKDSSLHVNALTMISKRVEAGDQVDLAAIAAWVLDHGRAADLREGN